MKNILTVLFFILTSLSLFGQNPIIKEELFEEYNGEWNKVSIVNRAYNTQGNLTFEETLYFENAIQKWIPFVKNWYDDAGNNIQTTQQYLQSPELGFYVNNMYRQFNDFGELMLEESFVKENSESETVASRRMVRENLEDCSFVKRFYERNQTGTLEWSSSQLSIYDKNCDFAEVVYVNDDDTDIATLKNQIRISFESTPSGGQRRIVERLTCPESDNCMNWVISNKKTHDAAGRLIVEETGSINGSYRFIVSTAYEPTQTIVTADSYSRRFNSTTGQQLVNRQVTTLDLEENILSRIYIDPFSTREIISEYNEEGLLHKNLIIRRVKDSTGIKIFRDTTDFIYQNYCDGLSASQTIDYGNNFKTKTTYSYLYPADCGQANTITDFLLFPNPVNALLNIENEAFVNGAYTLDIFDIMGRPIRSFSNYRSNAITVNVADLPNGVYQLSIQTVDGRITKPFAIDR